MRSFFPFESSFVFDPSSNRSMRVVPRLLFTGISTTGIALGADTRESDIEGDRDREEEVSGTS